MQSIYLSLSSALTTKLCRKERIGATVYQFVKFVRLVPGRERQFWDGSSQPMHLEAVSHTSRPARFAPGRMVVSLLVFRLWGWVDSG